ncbi:MAG TPA: hypothetical protein VJ385_08555, partial [Fibrobacteria bacterium]|nr:hypothetical protein [Fibrobacteria bacterium]
MENAVEIKRSKRLKGQPVLQGDGLTGFQALLMGALAEGPTRLENLPDSPWFRDILQDFIRMGYAQQALDGHWTIHGGSAPVSGPEPLRVRHEAELLTLAGFLAAKDCRRKLAIDPACVSGEAMELLGRILKLEAVPELASAAEAGMAPAAAEPPAPPDSAPAPNQDVILLEAPTGLTPRTAAQLRPAGSASAACKPSELGWDEYQAKLALLSFHLASGLALDLSLSKSGPDWLETLAAQFGGPIRVEKNEAPEGDELARRIAR